MSLMIGKDGATLLDALWSEGGPGWTRSLPALETLRRMWVQQFMIVDGGAQLRPAEFLPRRQRESTPRMTQ